MNSGKIFLGILAGVAVGATLGVLFAPKRGSSTRKRIARKSDEYLDDMEEKFYDFIDTTVKKYKGVKEETSSMVEHGKQKVAEFADEIK